MNRPSPNDDSDAVPNPHAEAETPGKALLVTVALVLGLLMIVCGAVAGVITGLLNRLDATAQVQPDNSPPPPPLSQPEPKPKPNPGPLPPHPPATPAIAPAPRPAPPPFTGPPEFQ